MGEIINDGWCVFVIGGGIGGFVMVLVFVCQGICVKLFEQVEWIGEIGVGIQFVVNVFNVFDVLGVGEVVCGCVVLIDWL